MASTEDCKKFIVDIMSTNPSIVTSIFFHGPIPELDGTLEEIFYNTLLEDARNPKKWKRMYKCKPGSGNYMFEEYEVYDKKTQVMRMGYGGTTKFPASRVVSERGFMLDGDDYENGVQFVVIEDVDGKLHVANYIGE